MEHSALLRCRGSGTHAYSYYGTLFSPVPQQGGPFPFFNAPEVAQPAGAHGSWFRKGHEDQLRVALWPSVGLSLTLEICGLLSEAGGLATAIV